MPCLQACDDLADLAGRTATEDDLSRRMKSPGGPHDVLVSFSFPRSTQVPDAPSQARKELRRCADWTGRGASPMCVPTRSVGTRFSYLPHLALLPCHPCLRKRNVVTYCQNR